MAKPTLFVGLHGPLLVPSAAPDDYLGAGIAEYAKPFLSWAKGKFQVQVLTDESPRHVFVLAEQLGLPADALTARGFDVSKTEAMHPHEDFYWVDSELIPSEVTWLGQHKVFHRFLSVDPTEGVTPKHKEALEGLTRSGRTNR